MKRLSEYEKGYIEGVIDTDGSLSFHKAKTGDAKRGWGPQVEMSVSNNSRAVLNKIQDILGTDLKIVKKPSGNLQLKWVTNILRCLLPQIKLVTKEEKRKVILDYLELADKVTYTWNNHIEELENLFDRWDKIDENKEANTDYTNENKETVNTNHINENKELTDYERGFIEAVIDMDSNLGLYRFSSKEYKRGWVPKARLTVFNNSVKLLNKTQEILGTNKSIVGKKHHQISFGISTLNWLLPQLNLIVKQKEQELILRYLDIRRSDYCRHSKNRKNYENKLAALTSR